ncbi:isochorismatase family protein [Dyadobacter sp. CY261]|uniref:cysteine hydrolase family protein n=1 Tax=Dyadobacter sp. CY261 TaxID=2907203 RepID=UPI001F2037B8|nr:isochorismatase family protein [Dyadobacter sp. CY261]MCF0069795.1 isochorismatase family protein [Dyadobacter sp. CY261]
MISRKALLVIDMQRGSFTEATPRHNTEGVVQIINSLATTFRAKSWPVLFIQHDGSTMNEFVPFTTEWELLDDLKTDTGDIRIDKYANDVFYRSELGQKLDMLAINELVITGCATDFCVESTIQSAVSKDYNITVIEDGHTTGNRPNLQASQVIDHYNWVWKNMIPTKGKIEVLSHHLFLQQVLDK